MNIESAASALKELGHQTRLAIYKELVKAGLTGMSVGELQKRIEIPASTLSHHLSALMSVGLIKQERQGRTLFCHSRYEKLEELMAFLVEECCAGVSCPRFEENLTQGNSK
ncbi:helix-turn-helix transcriptional regulator [Salmonella enterica]|uniref:Helix-turn-helix transcriptional regulator n=1 Tax=Salmonella enterica subsp. enterica serovar Agona TaxID=58095 RepID=A0A625ABZ2_SALET|nr:MULTISPECIES: metalloregulator ArsR/SmtB family transcription factor [Enterobacterales]EAU7051013.1 ArsR family transcriptional regulator [Salmonella enterica]EAW1492656.1 ArsR family transcriptional regulator [Salmonella enterica subsp. enterica]EBH8540374.1 ArsR family transcriptional regulator [Salmonella enterica subsp. enterica serovar Urbana]ECD6934028.1 ArsR family transcriptional regulator [Salmonella enterica subsp. enterica serovar Saintpaul]ECH9578966.1 helix-turn-helix transcrip